MGPHEPYWRTNTSFSPPPSRWDFRFQSEGLPYGSNDDIQLYGSSTSASSKDSRTWLRGSQLPSHQYSISDGAGQYFSSPSDISQAPHWQWTPPGIGLNIDDYENTRRDPVSSSLSLAPAMEAASTIRDGGGYISSHSDGSEYDQLVKSQLSNHGNFSSRCSFMSKPIHPMSFSNPTPTRETSDTIVTGISEFDAAGPQREAQCWSSASSSIDLTDVSELFDSENLEQPHNPSGVFKCGLCERLLSQRSPWSTRRIVRSGDMPVAGVLSCSHVFHAECLEQTTPKTLTNDPPCPICVRSEWGNSPEDRVISRLRKGLPKVKPCCEEGVSRAWGCAQAGDCVEGALHAPARNTMLLLNRNRIRKNLALRGSNSSRESPGKLKKSVSISSQLVSGWSIAQGANGGSKTTAGPSMKRL